MRWNWKQALGVAMACVTMVGCFCMNVGATEPVSMEIRSEVARATGQFSMDIPANTMVKASSSFPLEVGEVVTIKASYSPFSASVDFGLIAPDGLFYFINVTNGSIDQRIKVDQRGNYTLAVRNNSSQEISVSGFVNY